MPHANPAPEARQTRIVLIDDHPMVRERLAELIAREPDLAVCGEAEDRTQALKIIASTRPDLAIVDLSLKGSHGLDLIKDLQISHPRVLILVVSMQEESLYAERVIRAGARGYITKQEATRKIMAAIRKVLAGEVYLSENLAGQILSKLVGRRRPDEVLSVSLLTDRELQVFDMTGQGLGARQIAEQLRLDVKTVETYRARIKEKLHLKDAAELLQRAIAWVHHRDV
jgi:DNA-binding NarL/FixJ family response regulator